MKLIAAVHPSCFSRFGALQCDELSEAVVVVFLGVLISPVQK